MSDSDSSGEGSKSSESGTASEGSVSENEGAESPRSNQSDDASQIDDNDESPTKADSIADKSSSNTLPPISRTASIVSQAASPSPRQASPPPTPHGAYSDPDSPQAMDDTPSPSGTRRPRYRSKAEARLAAASAAESERRAALNAGIKTKQAALQAQIKEAKAEAADLRSEIRRLRAVGESNASQAEKDEARLARRQWQRRLGEVTRFLDSPRPDYTAEEEVEVKYRAAVRARRSEMKELGVTVGVDGAGWCGPGVTSTLREVIRRDFVVGLKVPNGLAARIVDDMGPMTFTQPKKGK